MRGKAGDVIVRHGGQSERHRGAQVRIPSIVHRNSYQLEKILQAR